MSRQLQAFAPPVMKSRVERDGNAYVVAIFALVPVFLTSGLMLMQVLGVWSY